jgi:hypothetical protein
VGDVDQVVLPLAMQSNSASESGGTNEGALAESINFRLLKAVSIEDGIEADSGAPKARDFGVAGEDQPGANAGTDGVTSSTVLHCGQHFNVFISQRQLTLPTGG